MNKQIVSGLVALTILSSAVSGAYAGSVKAGQDTREVVETNETRNLVVNNQRTESQVVNLVQYRSEVLRNNVVDNHRVVVGNAAIRLGPNFLDNDWDIFNGVHTHQARNLLRQSVTADEAAFLRSLSQLPNGANVFVDMTGRTVSLNSFDFSPKTSFVGSSNSQSSSLSVSVSNSSRIDSSTASSRFDEVLVSEEVLSIGAFDFARHTVEAINHVLQNVTTNTQVNTVTTTNVNTITNTRTDTYKTVQYQLVAAVYDYSPVMLDLGGDRKADVAHHAWLPHAPKFYKDYARFFDITGDGAVDFTEWMAGDAKDGILVMPEDGKVEGALQMFGTAGGYKDGYEKLSLVCDKDGNGWVEGGELQGLALWVDANNNAECDKGELRSLKQYNISRINTRHNNFVSSFQTADGASHMSWDWWPAAMEVRSLAQ